MSRETTDGALLLDKPVGLSSNRALQEAKKLLGAKKAGHAGTLDPLASGLLLALFGEATKFAGPLLDADKEYLATLKLGETTTTGDAEGEVVQKSAVTVGEKEILSSLEAFRGEIEQVPPMYSALKRDGVPLYRLARRGEQVERSPRRVSILGLTLVRRSGDLVELAVRCSKGTYIRVLAEDIGRALGPGAHLAALRRTAAGGFRVEEAVTLDALAGLAPEARTRRLVPLARLLGGLPRAELDAAAEGRFRNGQALAVAMPQGLCGVFGRDGGVIGLGRADAGGALRPLRLTQAAEKHR
jgi:tRNA pseudouridine55 synthase